MQTLSKDLRRVLENTARKARQVAEAGARAALQQLTVADKDAGSHLSAGQKALRNRLRAHARQLGDPRDQQRGTQAIGRLVVECAYEHWHRLLFARFLAETELLIEPESGQAISLGDCQELARSKNADWLDLAAEYAQRMLPQIFRSGDPVLEVALPPETRSALEDLMKGLPRDVFVAEDSLGWVYQYWQADRKEEINRSEKKIGADELPAVTQLFTEDYMVLFLLHNTLGAWWAGKVMAKNPSLAASAANENELRAACAVGDIEWTYLRFVREGDGPWRPAAGTFDGWPKAAKEITVLDPCMGSGHFLVFALPIVAAMRQTEESLSPEAAIDAVLSDNLFGLEIDPRCTQIAAFNLALAAWRRSGYRQLPPLHLACSGLSLGVTKAEWLKLAERTAQVLPVPPKTDLLGTEDNLFSDAMKRGFERLYELFARAPWLGSLIDPREASGDLIEKGFSDLEAILSRVVGQADSVEISEMTVAAQGIAKAAAILSQHFVLIATNVPYLGREGHDPILADYAQRTSPDAAADLATLFLRRCLKASVESGTVAIVHPQNWWVGTAYSDFRRWIVSHSTWRITAILGEEAWESFGNRGPNTVLLIAEKQKPLDQHMFRALDVSTKPGMPVVGISAKIQALGAVESNAIPASMSAFIPVRQLALLAERNSRISTAPLGTATPLRKYVVAGEGSSTGDNDRFLRRFWEVARSPEWLEFSAPGFNDAMYCDTSLVVLWEGGNGELARSQQARIQSTGLWRRSGVLIGRVRGITACLFLGGCFSKGGVLVCPHDDAHLIAIYAFLKSKAFEDVVRQIDPRVSAATSVVTDVPFDLERWQKVGEEEFPNGLPAPYSNDATQWLFAGNPAEAQTPLDVAVARLVGYGWPNQEGGLEKHADRDGIVTLSPVKGEQSGESRLTALLADVFGNEWSAAKLNQLLAEVGFAGRTLDDWLRDGFFEQHCELFHQRPFVWQIWDGRRDGFHALVNYHRLVAPNGEGRRTLEKLLYTYLGDWTDRQRADQRAGIEGADARVAAAEQLKTELESILGGEPPYDLFARWKPLGQQPIGWEPDVNDGVRINIRPFLTAKPLGARARGACILRNTPKIKWDKDRGKELECSKEEYPWFWGWDGDSRDFRGGPSFDGSRWNDLHYSVAAKMRARGHRSE